MTAREIALYDELTGGGTRFLRVDELIRKYHDLWGLSAETTTAYLCGNGDMIEHVKGILKRARYAKESIFEEVYW